VESAALSWPLQEDPDAEDCGIVQNQCISRTGCSMALQNYMISCGPVVHGSGAEEGEQRRWCTLDCRNALLTLLSMDDRQGEKFMTCRCNGNAMCEQQRRMLGVCHEEVLRTLPVVMDNLTDISCTLAQWICSADTSCIAALNYYNLHCTKLFRGEKCTGKCNNSLSILYKQKKARKLRTCICDGSEMYNCEALRYNTETLCRHNPLLVPEAGGHGEGEGDRVRHPHGHHPHTPDTPTEVPWGWGEEEGGWDEEQTATEEEEAWEESEEEEEEGEEEKDPEQNYTAGRHRKNLTISGATSLHTVTGGYCSIVLLYYLILAVLYPVLKCSTSYLVLL
jgi:growth arrest-specific protein 1